MWVLEEKILHKMTEGEKQERTLSERENTDKYKQTNDGQMGKKEW